MATPALQKTVQGYQRRLTKVCVWGGGLLPGGEGGGGVTLEMCAIAPCNVDQAVCTVHMHSSLPWCWGQASSTSGRGGPV